MVVRSQLQACSDTNCLKKYFSHFKMNKEDIDNQYNIKLLSFDIDNTLLDFHTLKSNFTKTWNKYKSKSDVLLTYNTGRLIDDALSLIKKNVLPEPDYIISGVGTLIYDFKSKSVVKEFNDVLDDGWDLKAVEQVTSEAIISMMPVQN